MCVCVRKRDVVSEREGMREYVSVCVFLCVFQREREEEERRLMIYSNIILLRANEKGRALFQTFLMIYDFITDSNLISDDESI